MTEAHVYRALDEAFPDACIGASVHRMSALTHFDQVVLMADGIVLGSGTVDEMRASQRLFAAMTQEPDDAREARAAA